MANPSKKAAGKGSRGAAARPANSAKGAPRSGGPAKPSAAFTSGIGALAGPDKVLWWCLHLLVFLVPIGMANITFLGFSTPLTYDQFDIIKIFFMRAITLVAVGAWAWKALMQGGRIRLTSSDWLIVAFLAWVAITTVLSIHWPTALFGKYRRFEGLVSFVNYAAVFFLAVQIVDRPSRIRSIANTLFYSGTIVAFYGVMQYLGVDPVRWGSLPFEEQRAFSTFGNPDLLGGFLLFPLPIALALALSEEERTWRIVYWVGFLINVACWLTAFVRGAWIGGVVALAILAFAAFRGRSRLNVVDYSFAGAIAVIAAIIVVRSLSAESEVLNVVARIKSIFHFSAGSAATRFMIWESAIAAVKDSPIVGFGADTFRLLFPKYKTYEYVAAAGYLSVADNVHNYPLQLATGIGIPGVLLMYATFAWTAVKSAGAAFAKDRGGERLLLAGLWAACAGYIVHLLFGLSVTGSTVFLWLCMAMLLTPVARSVNVSAPGWGTLAAVLVVVAVAAASVGNVVYLAADRAYLRARVVSQGVMRIQDVEQAIRLNPTNDMYRSELGLAYQDVFLQLASEAQTVRQQGGDPTQLQAQATQAFAMAEKAYKDVIEFVPTEYDNYVFISNLYNAGADLLDRRYLQQAVEWGQKAVEVEPFGPAARFQLALAYYRLGRMDEARSELEEATQMDPAYADAQMLLGDMYRDAGEYEKAKKAYEAALSIKPDDPRATNALNALEASMAATATTTPPSSGP